MLENSAGAANGKSMVNEESEHVGNLPGNVFPISAGVGGRAKKVYRYGQTQRTNTE